MSKRRNKHWSHNAGQKGLNWVRAYQDGRDGKFYVQWMEPRVDPGTGEAVRERNAQGILEPLMRKRSKLLHGVTEPAVARGRAERLAARFLELEAADTVGAAALQSAVSQAVSPDEGLLVSELIDFYLDERTPQKEESTQDHDRRAARIFQHHLQGVRSSALDRTHWDGYVAARREGRILHFGPVEARQVEQDLKFLIAVLTWGLGAKDEFGRPYLKRHPWSAERRKATGMRMPKGGRPHRPSMSDEIREGLIAHSPHPQFAAALQLGRHTVSRNSSVRHLQWADVDLENGTARWRGEFDKNEQDIRVPLPTEAIAALRSLPRGIGETWVFASARDPKRPTPRNTFQTWLRRAKAAFLASIEDPVRRRRLEQEMKGLGFHGEKRAGVRDPRFRNLAPKIQEAIARTNHETLRKIYDDVDTDEIRAAMRQQGLLGGGSDELRAVC